MILYFCSSFQNDTLMKKSSLFFLPLLLLLVGFATVQAQTTQTILSPNQKLMVDLGGDRIRYSISDGQGEIMDLPETYE